MKINSYLKFHGNFSKFKTQNCEKMKKIYKIYKNINENLRDKQDKFKKNLRIPRLEAISIISFSNLAHDSSVRNYFSLLSVSSIIFVVEPKSIMTPCSHEVAEAKASYILAHRMVRKSLTNGLRTKCAYVWMGLQTCAAPSAKGSHTIHREPKFVGLLRKHKENWMRWVSFPCTGCPLLASGSQKIN